ncbi:essential MCU regulator, mitochondrial-like isoform X2 [Channa argus]|uniref:essential MCU regulator, mitochondrial-like isoform X2 n=1 Tax=Channa argus TaxID=215402 RepID=UPI003521D659
MASVLGRLARLSALRNLRTAPVTSSSSTVTPCRAAVCTSSGGIRPKPRKTPLGLIRIALVVVPFLYLGTQISKTFAALLEEHDIFVPEDDDDDD